MDTQPIIPTDQKPQVVPIEQMVVFELDHEEYAVPILEVKEVIKLPQITQVPNSAASIAGIINLRGKVVPVLDLEKKFNLVRENKTPSEHILVAEAEGGLAFGILVDKVSEVAKIPQSSIKAAPQVIAGKIAADFLKGVVVNQLEGRERIMLLLDLKKILSDKETEGLKTEQIKAADPQTIDSGPSESVTMEKETQPHDQENPAHV
jgi:purine-binding chemotaxis protein CheW